MSSIETKAKFSLSNYDHETFEIVIEDILLDMIHKMSIQSSKPWWKDWKLGSKHKFM